MATPQLAPSHVAIVPHVPLGGSQLNCLGWIYYFINSIITIPPASPPGWFPAELFSQLNLLVCVGISREIRKDLAGAQQRSRRCLVSHRCCTFTVAALLQRCCSSVALLLHRRCIIVALLCNTISESRTCQLLCMAHKTLHAHLSSSVQKISCLAHIYKKIFGCAEDWLLRDDDRMGLGRGRGYCWIKSPRVA